MMYNLAPPRSIHIIWGVFEQVFKEEGPELGTKPLKALRGHQASSRGSKKALIEALGGSNRGSKTLEKTPEALRD